MARSGKIARLPFAIREQLNQRLRDNEPGVMLLRWLNSLPEVNAILSAQFHSEPINPANLSQWKSGGYREWVTQQENLEHALNSYEQLAPILEASRIPSSAVPAKAASQSADLEPNPALVRKVHSILAALESKTPTRHPSQPDFKQMGPEFSQFRPDFNPV